MFHDETGAKVVGIEAQIDEGLAGDGSHLEGIGGSRGDLQLELCMFGVQVAFLERSEAEIYGLFVLLLAGAVLRGNGEEVQEAGLLDHIIEVEIPLVDNGDGLILLLIDVDIPHVNKLNLFGFG